jgi:hypothetical protein
MAMMNARRIRSAVALALVAGAALLHVGCAPGLQHAPPAWSGPAGTYEPVYYDGYVVYFDREGRPYHYDENDAPAWISTASPFYTPLIDHWARHREAYERWYAAYGARYRDYRNAQGDGVYKTRGGSGGFW